MNKTFKKIIGFVILVIYLISLTMECYLVNGKPSIGSFGLIALLLGWVNFDFVGLIWLANPLFILSLLIFFFSKKKRIAVILSLIVSILAISFLLIKEIIWSEAGHVGEITGYLTGYWLWVSAILLMTINLLLNKNYVQEHL